MHFLMEDAEVLIVFCGLPTLFMVAAVDLAHLRFVLTEIESFSWEHLTSNGYLKVFVRDNSVLVKIEPVKDILELSLSNGVHTPKLQEKFKLSL